MRIVAGIALLLALAACSKQEQPPTAKSAEKPAAAKSAGAELARSAPASAPQDRASSVPTSSALTGQPPASAALLKQGETLFTDNCATCHMADGGGVPNMQPAIIGSAWISNPDPQLLLSLILRGAKVMGEAANAYDNKMPPLDHLSDDQVAAVATYVRQRFAAAPIAEPVTPAQVALARSRPGLP